MRATVRLKEGASYHLDGNVFTQEPLDITDPGLIAKCKNIGVLAVTMHEDEPVAQPAKPSAPAVKKPGPPPKPAAPAAAKPGPKPAAAKPSAPASAPAGDKED